MATAKTPPITPDRPDRESDQSGTSARSSETGLEVPPRPGAGSNEQRDKAYGPGGATAVGSDVDSPTAVDTTGPEETGAIQGGAAGLPGL